jgi:hypothetical protein
MGEVEDNPVLPGGALCAVQSVGSSRKPTKEQLGSSRLSVKKCGENRGTEAEGSRAASF